MLLFFLFLIFYFYCYTYVIEGGEAKGCRLPYLLVN